ncbi:hypothetical protein, partial [Acinetobacter baumannii]
GSALYYTVDYSVTAGSGTLEIALVSGVIGTGLTSGSVILPAGKAITFTASPADPGDTAKWYDNTVNAVFQVASLNGAMNVTVEFVP